MDSISATSLHRAMAQTYDDEDAETASKRDRLALNPKPQTARYLKQLVSLGIYGSTPTAVAARLVDEGIRLAIKDGLIDKERE